jgi:hypothetical protein
MRIFNIRHVILSSDTFQKDIVQRYKKNLMLALQLIVKRQEPFSN